MLHDWSASVVCSVARAAQSRDPEVRSDLMRRTTPFLFVALLCSLLPACSPASAKPGPTATPAQMPQLDRLLIEGAKLNSGGDAMTIGLLEIGTLHLPTGEVIATDPFTEPERKPFSLKVKPGDYPVTLSLARDTNSAYATIAAASIAFSRKKPIKWALATIPGQDPALLKQDEIFGYPVDSGTGSFLSPPSAQALRARFDALPGLPNIPYIRQISDEMEKNASTGMWTNLPLDSEGRLNALLFSSGYGDGAYASYWGYDDEGNVACLLTDFGVVE